MIPAAPLRIYVNAVVQIHQQPSPTHISPHRKPSAMDDDSGAQTGIVLGTAFASIIAGYMFGVFTTRGYFISPELVEERRRNLKDPVESDESDIDEDDTLMDHAPNWANGEDADRRQGLKLAAEKKARAEVVDNGEECKLVLCVRTDLGMTKGMLNPQPHTPS